MQLDKQRWAKNVPPLLTREVRDLSKRGGLKERTLSHLLPSYPVYIFYLQILALRGDQNREEET